MRIFFLFFLVIGSYSKAADTLYKHPIYPPIVYEGDEYNFFKYTPKYIPENLLHSFKILGTLGESALSRFKKRPIDEVVDRGIFENGYRMRKEFCLEGFSPFVHFFHKRGIYSPYAMQTFILLSFHQYLNEEKINWHENKRLALEDIHGDNRNWKSRSRKIMKPIKPEKCEKPKDEDKMTEEEKFFNY